MRGPVNNLGTILNMFASFEGGEWPTSLALRRELVAEGHGSRWRRAAELGTT